MTAKKPKQTWLKIMGGFAVGQIVNVDNWRGKWLITGILEKENGRPMVSPFQLEAQREAWEPQAGDPVVIWANAGEMRPSEDETPTVDPRQELGVLLRQALAESTALQAVGNRFTNPYAQKINLLLERAIEIDDRQVLEEQLSDVSARPAPSRQVS